MGDVMFTIESITDDIVKLENRDTLEVIYEKKKFYLKIYVKVILLIK